MTGVIDDLYVIRRLSPIVLDVFLTVLGEIFIESRLSV
jgi:hypothetical protein